uniref:C2H2-type domain-containing protein n=1 Tax=Globodera rostochiensis TaxID=31243 RepID=A0A914HKN7_GLORO
MFICGLFDGADVCERAFASASGREKHRQKAHTRQERGTDFDCERCQYGGFSEFWLYRHMLSKHRRSLIPGLANRGLPLILSKPTRGGSGRRQAWSLSLPGDGGAAHGQTATVRATSHRKLAGFVPIGPFAPDVLAAYNTARTLAENTVASRVQSGFFVGSNIEVRFYPNSMPHSGTSTGLTCATALVSLALNIPTPTDVAMSGTIDVLGNITAVGEVATKVQAAQAAGKRRIILPLANEAELDMFGEGDDRLFLSLITHAIACTKICLNGAQSWQKMRSNAIEVSEEV